MSLEGGNNENHSNFPIQHSMANVTMGIKQRVNEQNGRQKLLQSILDLGTKAFSPEAEGNPQAREQSRREFDSFVQRSVNESISH